jgi:hypothetical protein
MVSHRWRPVWYCAFAVILTWSAALTGYVIAKNSTPTAEAIREWMQSLDFPRLSAAERANAIQKLTTKLNALPVDERRRAQLERVPRPWFEEMTDAEKRAFIKTTMPAGLTQMLAAFEQLPDDRRKRAIEDTLRRLRESQNRLRMEGSAIALTNLPRLSSELQSKMRSEGWAELYKESPPQTQADLAPILEELQRVMESGRPLRGRP